IVIFTQFYPPEIGATQTRLSTFAEGLASDGHQVEVICEIPNHPHGIVASGWRRVPIQRHTRNGVNVWYVWVYTRPAKSAITRLLFYGTYAAMAISVGMLMRRPDVILASSPPLPVGAVGAVVAL